MNKFIVFSLFGFLFGCNGNMLVPNNPSGVSVDEKTKSYIGETYAVMYDDVYIGIRKFLHDGQVLTIIDARRSRFGTAEVLVADSSGNKLFDKYYAFGDLGLLNEQETPIYTDVNPDISMKGVLGEKRHGFSGSYKSVVTKTKIEGVVAYGGPASTSGLGAQCSDTGDTLLTYKSSEIIGAPSSEVEYSIYVDEGEVFSGRGRMFKGSYESLYFKPSQSVVESLRKGKRGAINIKTLSSDFTRRFYLDGFNEMYSRIDNNCID
ncbi:hypothetical protein [Neptunomonas phycophila]|uniref:hypothetical protein n=1 Tax=Neptunomonas phycophila TaxID=1572645 RepID=UPI003734C795